MFLFINFKEECDYRVNEIIDPEDMMDSFHFFISTKDEPEEAIKDYINHFMNLECCEGWCLEENMRELYEYNGFAMFEVGQIVNIDENTILKRAEEIIKIKTKAEKEKEEIELYKQLKEKYGDRY